MDEQDIDDVLDICIAYEQGYSAGQSMIPAEYNIYTDKSKTYYAWLFGHNNSLTKEIIDIEETRPN